MSTTWGYRCPACRDDAPYMLNHGQTDLVRLARAREHVAVVAALPDVDVTLLGAEGAPADWLRRHRDCPEPVLLNEYGDALTLAEAEAGARPETARGVRVDDLRDLILRTDPAAVPPEGLDRLRAAAWPT